MIISDRVVESIRRFSKRTATGVYLSDPEKSYEAGLQDGAAIFAGAILEYLQDEPTGDKANA